MNEKKKTLIFAAAAVLLALVAMVTAPRRVTPSAFFDQGEPFFPNFTDPNSAVSLEVIDFNAETGEPLPFKVVFEKDKWRIPSHHDYPADNKDQLAQIAAGVITLRKDEFRTDNVADHAACGVLDPLDESNPNLEGRGQRIIIRGENDQVLADLIVGKKVPEKEGFRFVRLPDQKRVYAAKMDLKISTKFSDWIDTDLLKVKKNDITQVTLKDYSINEMTGTVRQRDVLVLTKEGNTWKANHMKSNQKVDINKMNQLLRAVDELSIVGVRPKPAGLSASLKKSEGGIKITRAAMASLQSKGYYFSRDGNLLSNEGEMQVRTKDGVVYTLRFGEVAYGRGLEVTAGNDSVEQAHKGPAENRYLFITTYFNEKQFKEPPKPANTDFLNKADSLWTDADHRNKTLYDAHQKWEEKVEKGRKLSEDLNNRFADWYYVISDASFKKLKLKRSDLVVKKK